MDERLALLRLPEFPVIEKPLNADQNVDKNSQVLYRYMFLQLGIIRENTCARGATMNLNIGQAEMVSFIMTSSRFGTSIYL